jgi:uncharacterized membrane protein
MDPVLAVAASFGLFAASHLGLAWPPLRARLVARLGPWGFVVAFSVVAWLSFGVAVATYAAHAQAGPAGPAWGRFALARALLIGAVALGVVLMTGTFARYAASPYAMSGRNAREPRGLERITRHPFFVGVAIFAGAHALLATRLTGALFMGGLALFALAGARLQDRKLLALRGDSYAAWCAATSTLPFAAIAAGRQRFVAAELPYGMLALGLALAFVLRAVHGSLFAHGGAYVILALVLGPLMILLDEWRRARRRPAPAAAPDAPAAG